MISVPFSSLTTLVLLSALTGCATAGGTSYFENPSSALAHSVSGAAQPTDPPISASTRVLDRAAFVRAVLLRNPSLESAKQAWRAASARVRESGTFDDPMLDLGVAPLSVGSSKAPLGYEVGISQKLPWFGKHSFEVAGAAADAEAVKSDYESVERDLALNAVLLYDQYFVATRALEINAQHVELMKALRDAATAQFTTSRASAGDALQAESELSHMEHDSAVLSSQRDVTAAQMNELLHRLPELPLPPPPRDLPPPLLPAADPKRLEAQALRERPEIAAAQQRARAQQARADGASRDSYPDVTVSTSYNSMWDMPEHRWMVGVGLNLPIQSGRRAALLDEATAARAQFESEAARLSDAARTQVFVALKQLEESQHVLRVFEQRLTPLARDRVAAARSGFVTSQNSFVAVMDAEKNLRQVELDYQVARAESDRHSAELEHALGRIPGIESQESDR
ncbi:MAG: TolC family protein [Polyangiaceae bacterium]